MIGIIIGIIAGFTYVGAAWSNDISFWAGAGGSMLLTIILGIILFPKTVARMLNLTLWFAPLAIIMSLFNGSFPVGTIYTVTYALIVAASLSIVKFFRLRARQVNL